MMMNQKTFRILAVGLIAAGILLIVLAVSLAWVATMEKDIIGGAGWPTFQLILRHEQGGLYGYALLGGVILVAAGVIVCLVKKPFRH